jgi:hypothetical protein
MKMKNKMKRFFFPVQDIRVNLKSTIIEKYIWGQFFKTLLVLWRCEN